MGLQIQSPLNLQKITHYLFEARCPRCGADTDHVHFGAQPNLPTFDESWKCAICDFEGNKRSFFSGPFGTLKVQEEVEL
jgi:hypothetical protein